MVILEEETIIGNAREWNLDGIIGLLPYLELISKSGRKIKWKEIEKRINEEKRKHRFSGKCISLGEILKSEGKAELCIGVQDIKKREDKDNERYGIRMILRKETSPYERRHLPITTKLNLPIITELNYVFEKIISGNEKSYGLLLAYVTKEVGRINNICCAEIIIAQDTRGKYMVRKILELDADRRKGVFYRILNFGENEEELFNRDIKTELLNKKKIIEKSEDLYKSIEKIFNEFENRIIGINLFYDNKNSEDLQQKNLSIYKEFRELQNILGEGIIKSQKIVNIWGNIGYAVNNVKEKVKENF